MLHFTGQTSTLLNILQCQEKLPPITPSRGVLVDPAVISRDDREWTSACRRYIFINHHALRQTMADPAAGWAAASQGQAFFAYDINALIDLRNAVIVDVEATTGIRHVA